MLQNRQQKPISPQEMFSRLLSQSYREMECQDQSQKVRKQRVILIQLIQQYEMSIESQMVRINQCGNLERLKLEKIEELQRLKRQRDIVQQSVEQQLNRISLTQGQQQQKLQLVTELQQVRCVNNKIRLKLRDLHQYVQKLQIHNRMLQNQKDLAQTKIATRMRVNSEDWKHNIDLYRKQQELQENQLKAKMLQKETQSLKNVRKQEEEIHKRNQQKWEQFRSTVFKPSLAPSYETGASGQVKSFISRRFGQGKYERFRVI